MALAFPLLYVLDNSLALNDLMRISTRLGSALTTDITETNIAIGNIFKPVLAKKVVNELLKPKGLCVRDVEHREDSAIGTVGTESGAGDSDDDHDHDGRPRKRRRLREGNAEIDIAYVDSSTESEPEDENEKISSTKHHRRNISSSSAMESREQHAEEDAVRVVKLNWFYDSLKEERILPIAKYLVYEGVKTKLPQVTAFATPTRLTRPASILARSRADTPPREQSSQSYHKHKYGHGRSSNPTSHKVGQPPKLLPESTSDHEEAENMPPLPAYLKTNYSCQRRTPLKTPNDQFLSQLQIIKKNRQLCKEKEGYDPALPYAHAIASIAAYPYSLTSWQEVDRLPGCGPSVVRFFREWRQNGRIKEVEEILADEYMKTLEIFFEIFDVGAKIARDWYKKGWRDLDDVIENWNSLTQSQQYGVKFYDDFAEKIPRSEVESIAATILSHANNIHPGFQMVIVGGYRRGKPLCGDVDVILTHHDESLTKNYISQIVDELGASNYITHELQHSERNSTRDQEPLAFKGSSEHKAGSGFCTLDKSFAIWQDARKVGKKNADGSDVYNPKRRVDIIVSPWKTAGCAILGWSGATQFERDLRGYCKEIKGVKFDSSGIRSNDDGTWMDYEKGEMDLLMKEKKVFEGLGLDWVEPTERCTG